MVLLADIQKYFKTLKLADAVYIGRLDADKNNVIGLYNHEPVTHKVIGLKTYDKASVTVLVHGGTSKSATEKFAQSVYDKLASASGKIGGKQINFIDMLYDGPVDVNQDSGKVYEYVINLDIYVER